jgi:hypothetical protein
VSRHSPNSQSEVGSEPTVQRPTSMRLEVRYENVALALKIKGIINDRDLARNEAVELMSEGVGSSQDMIP